MKKSVKNKWVAALRSGEYKQGQNRLRNKDKYCCLGVLCDLAPKKIGYWDKDDSFCNETSKSNENLIIEVMEWAGFNSYETIIEITLNGRIETNLAELNDGSGPLKQHNFNEIADLIEEHWEKL